MAVRGQQRRAANRAAKKAALRKACKEQYEKALKKLKARLKEFNGYRRKGLLLKLSEVCDDVAIACRTVLALDYILRSREYRRLDDSRTLHWIISGDQMSRIERAERDAKEDAEAQVKVPSPKRRRA